MTDPKLIKRAKALLPLLYQVEQNDWRIAHLAHTSDTAGDAAILIRDLLSALKEPVKVTDHRFRFRAGVRFAVTWLHKRAEEMNDPHARAILNGAALHLGQSGAATSPAALAAEATHETPKGGDDTGNSKTKPSFDRGTNRERSSPATVPQPLTPAGAPSPDAMELARGLREIADSTIVTEAGWKHIVKSADALEAAAEREKRQTKRIAELDAWRTENAAISVTVGGGLQVYGTSEAVGRVQDYILLDSTHPQEKEDVRRGLMQALQKAEASLATMTTERDRALEALDQIWRRAKRESVLPPRPAPGMDSPAVALAAEMSSLASIARSALDGVRPSPAAGSPHDRRVSTAFRMLEGLAAAEDDHKRGASAHIIRQAASALRGVLLPTHPQPTDTSPEGKADVPSKWNNAAWLNGRTDSASPVPETPADLDPEKVAGWHPDPSSPVARAWEFTPPPSPASPADGLVVSARAVAKVLSDAPEARSRSWDFYQSASRIVTGLCSRIETLEAENRGWSHDWKRENERRNAAESTARDLRANLEETASKEMVDVAHAFIDHFPISREYTERLLNAALAARTKGSGT